MMHRRRGPVRGEEFGDYTRRRPGPHAEESLQTEDEIVAFARQMARDAARGLGFSRRRGKPITV